MEIPRQQDVTAATLDHSLAKNRIQASRAHPTSEPRSSNRLAPRTAACRDLCGTPEGQIPASPPGCPRYLPPSAYRRNAEICEFGAAKLPGELTGDARQVETVRNYEGIAKIEWRTAGQTKRWNWSSQQEQRWAAELVSEFDRPLEMIDRPAGVAVVCRSRSAPSDKLPTAKGHSPGSMKLTTVSAGRVQVAPI